MNIYIAKDSNDDPISVILADNSEKAAVAFMGMNINMYSCEEIDPNDNLGMHGVCFLLNSTEYNSRDLPSRVGGITFRKWVRGI